MRGLRNPFDCVGSFSLNSFSEKHEKTALSETSSETMHDHADPCEHLTSVVKDRSERRLGGLAVVASVAVKATGFVEVTALKAPCSTKNGRERSAISKAASHGDMK